MRPFSQECRIRATTRGHNSHSLSMTSKPDTRRKCVRGSRLAAWPAAPRRGARVKRIAAQGTWRVCAVLAVTSRLSRGRVRFWCSRRAVQSHAEGTDHPWSHLPQHRGAAGCRPRLRRTLQCPVDRRKERLPEPRSSSSGVARRDLNQARRVRQTCVQGTGCATKACASHHRLSSGKLLRNRAPSLPCGFVRRTSRDLPSSPKGQAQQPFSLVLPLECSP